MKISPAEQSLLPCLFFVKTYRKDSSVKKALHATFQAFQQRLQLRKVYSLTFFTLCFVEYQKEVAQLCTHCSKNFFCHPVSFIHKSSWVLYCMFFALFRKRLYEKTTLPKRDSVKKKDYPPQKCNQLTFVVFERGFPLYIIKAKHQLGD